MKVQKVHNLPRDHAVEDIANRSAQHQTQSKRLVTRALCSQHVRQPCRYKQRQHDKEVTLPATCISQKAEGSARIQYINQIEVRGDRNLLSKSKGIGDHTFARLIQHRSKQG